MECHYPVTGGYMTTTIVTRAVKGSPLTNTEMDSNLTNLQATADAALPATSTAVNATEWNGAAMTVSTSAPSGGSDGDIWFEREA